MCQNHRKDKKEVHDARGVCRPVSYTHLDVYKRQLNIDLGKLFLKMYISSFTYASNLQRKPKRFSNSFVLEKRLEISTDSSSKFVLEKVAFLAERLMQNLSLIHI